MEKLFLIDGSSYLFRAYHALPPLISKTGLHTGALYGSLNMLKKLILDHKPEYIALIFDSKEKNFRHEIFPSYKANRSQMPEELAEQIAPLFEIIKALGLPLIQIPGIEADDVIATLSYQAKDQELNTTIISSDKDLAQLVEDGKISILDTMKNKVYNRETVFEKFEVYPEQIADWLTLTGDSVDNIPGVPKVGPKTASKWLQQYSSLENLLAHQDEIPGKVGESLRTTASHLNLYKQLVLLNTNLDLNIDPKSLEAQTPQLERLKKLLETYEIKSWLKDFPQAWMLDSKASEALAASRKSNSEPQNLSKTHDHDIYHIQAIHEFETLLNSNPKEPHLNNLNNLTFIILEDQIFFSYNLNNPKTYSLSKNNADHFYNVLNKKQNIKKISYHLKNLEQAASIQSSKNWLDLNLASYVFNSIAIKHEISEIAQFYLNKNWQALNITEKLNCLNQLFLYFREKMPKVTQTVLENIEMPLLSVLQNMESHGILIDTLALNQQSEALGQTLETLEKRAYDLAGMAFNMNSPKQLGFVLFEKLQLPILEKTPKGQASTAESVLQELALSYELPNIIMEYRSLSKLKSTYTDSLPQQINPKTGRIHTIFHQNITATGRLSSSHPNLQNIPIRSPEGQKIREAFIASPGCVLISADYSQIELRIMAHFSEEPNLIYAFQNNIDIHRQTAAEILGLDISEVSDDARRQAKAVNFGLIYGMSSFGLAKQINSSQQAAQDYINLYFEKFPKVKTFMENTRTKAQEQGYVETIFGRRLYLPNIKAKNPALRNAQIRAAINAPLQGSAADIIKIAMIKIQEFINSEFPKGDLKLLLQVHDELVFEASEDLIKSSPICSKIQDIMQNSSQLSVPLTVELGYAKNWRSAH
ncbi:MAG: DNA polymerase I [Gammaproteobacteria bacterium]